MFCLVVQKSAPVPDFDSHASIQYYNKIIVLVPICFWNPSTIDSRFLATGSLWISPLIDSRWISEAYGDQLGPRYSIILVYYMYHIDAKEARSGPEADFGTSRRKPLYKSWIGGGNIGVARHMQFHDFTLFVILSLGWFPQCRQNTFFLPELGKPTLTLEKREDKK